ncbi:MAG: helix-turn-helix transcriptional regulator [Pseudomonadota bacterium]
MEKNQQPDPVDVYVGGRVKQIRTRLGISQEKLGEYLGVTFQQIQKYEKGSNRISASRLYQIGAMLNTEIQFFFPPLLKNREFSNEGFSEPNESEFELKAKPTADTADLLEAFSRLQNNNVRKHILELVVQLAGDGAQKDPAS